MSVQINRPDFSTGGDRPSQFAPGYHTMSNRFRRRQKSKQAKTETFYNTFFRFH